MQSGFWQLKVHPESREKTDFITPDGLWQFKKMPFGLCNSPASFQRMMDIVLSGQKWNTCLIYLDDVVVFSRTFAEHLENLNRVLLAIRQAGLRLKINKCHFGETRLHMLGHVVDSAGVHPDPEKVRAVKDFPTPTDVKSIQSFVGLCSYYRKFIPNFAEIARPLTALTKITTPFIWGPEEEASLQLLKETLVKATVLSHPDYNVLMEIHPDASGYGIGAVLVQKINGKETPLGFASRLLKGSELNYTITEKECLSVVSALKKFQYIVWGCQINVITDHHALCWLMSKKELSGRLARWAAVVQGENLKILHKSGKLHRDADAMSRYPVAGGDNEVDEFNENFVPLCCLLPENNTDIADSTDKIALAQQKDEEFLSIYHSLLNE